MGQAGSNEKCWLAYETTRLHGLALLCDMHMLAYETVRLGYMFMRLMILPVYIYIQDWATRVYVVLTYT